MTNKKVYVFTHTDLDGISAGSFLKTVFGENTEVAHIETKDIDKKVTTFLDEKKYEKYDLIIMTDITTNETVSQRIDDLLGDKFLIIDHHKSALELNKYDWANVILTKNDVAACATNLVLEYCIENELVGHLDSTLLENMKAFAEVVRSYDTFEWKMKQYEYPNRVDMLRKIKGNKRFLQELEENNYVVTYTAEDKEELEKREYQYKGYVQAKLNEIIDVTLTYQNKPIKLGVVEAHSSLSLLGNDLSFLRKDLDGIAMIAENYGIVSYRTTKDIDLSVVVTSLFDGGGHPRACGSEITKSQSLIKVYEELKKNSAKYKKLNTDANIGRVLCMDEDYYYKYSRLAIGLTNFKKSSMLNDLNYQRMFESIQPTFNGLLINNEELNIGYLVNYKGVLKFNFTSNKSTEVLAIIPSTKNPIEWYDNEFSTNPETKIYGITKKMYPYVRQLLHDAYYLRTPIECDGININRNNFKKYLPQLHKL